MAEVNPPHMGPLKMVSNVKWGGGRYAFITVTVPPVGPEDQNNRDFGLLYMTIDSPVNSQEFSPEHYGLVYRYNENTSVPPDYPFFGNRLHGIKGYVKPDLSSHYAICSTSITPEVYIFKNFDDFPQNVDFTKHYQTIPGTTGHTQYFWAWEVGPIPELTLANILERRGALLAPYGVTWAVEWTGYYWAWEDRDGDGYKETYVWSGDRYRVAETFPPEAPYPGIGRRGGDINYIVNLSKIYADDEVNATDKVKLRFFDEAGQTVVDNIKVSISIARKVTKVDIHPSTGKLSHDGTVIHSAKQQDIVFLPGAGQELFLGDVYLTPRFDVTLWRERKPLTDTLVWKSEFTDTQK